MANDNPQGKAPVDKDKELLMEVSNIINGCLDSDSKKYKTALLEIVITIGNHGIVLPPVV